MFEVFPEVMDLQTDVSRLTQMIPSLVLATTPRRVPQNGADIC